MDNVTIHKYQFDLSDEIEIVVTGVVRRLLTIQKQRGVWCVWVEVALLDGTKSNLRLNVVGTGHPVPQHDGYLHYFTTVQDGPWCWHFYA